MGFSGLGAVFISYSTAWCVRTTSSTTYRYAIVLDQCSSILLLIRRFTLRSMVGALNKLPVAASGLIFFGDPVTFSSVTGIFTGFVAGLVYAIAKQTQSKNSTSFLPRILVYVCHEDRRYDANSLFSF